MPYGGVLGAGRTERLFAQAPYINPIEWPINEQIHVKSRSLSAINGSQSDVRTTIGNVLAYHWVANRCFWLKIGCRDT